MSRADTFETALWVTCEGKHKLLDSRAGFDLLLKLLPAYSIKTVFLQVFRSGRAWFSSNSFEQWQKQNADIRHLLEELQNRGVCAHAWINVCNAGLDPSPKYLQLLGGDDGALRDGQRRTTVELPTGFSLDTPGLWLDPSNPRLKLAMQTLIHELTELEFEGVHLDFIRYPYTVPIKPVSWVDCAPEFGYLNAIEKKFAFKNSTINGLVPKDEANALLFDTWRRDQIDQLVRSAKEQLPTSWRLSVAALSWSDRAYLNAFQDWRSWLQRKLCDDLCLMTYSADSHLIDQQIRQAKAFLQDGQTLFSGIGLYKLASDEQRCEQEKLIADLKAVPCYFCADRLLEKPFSHH